MNLGQIISFGSASILAVSLIIFIVLILITIYMNKIGNRKFCKSSRKLTGLTALITGGTNGVGKETVLDFAQRGAKIIMACRNVQKAEATRQEIMKTTKNEDIRVIKLDLADLQSVRDAAKDILANENQLDIIVNNAGIAFGGGVTKDKFQIIFQSNYIGHFLLNYLLLELIIKSKYARIVSVSSMLYVKCLNLDFTPVNDAGEKYPFLESYEDSKLAMILQTKYMAKLLKKFNVKTYVVHPGLVATGIFEEMGKRYNIFLTALFGVVVKLTAIDSRTGAQTQIYCAVDEKAEKETGLFYDNCGSENLRTALSKDENLEKKLWEESCKMVSVDPYPECLKHSE